VPHPISPDIELTLIHLNDILFSIETLAKPVLEIVITGKNFTVKKPERKNTRSRFERKFF
jgi:uncharacterized membrane protein